MANKYLHLTFLTVFYGLYIAGIVMLFRQEPATETTEQLYYFASILLFFPLGLFFARIHYHSTSEKPQLLQNQLVILGAFLTFSITLARSGGNNLALLTLFSGLGISLALGMLATGFRFKLSAITGLWMIASLLLFASMNWSVITVAVAIITLLCIYELQRQNAITIVSMMVVIAASHFLLIDLLVIVASIVTVGLSIGKIPAIEDSENTAGFNYQLILDVLVIFLIILFTFDLSLPYDTHHYNPYLAVINDVLNGKTVMVDTYSMYGVSMPYILAIPFALDFLPLTAHSLSFIYLALTCVQFILLYVIMRQLTSSVAWSATGIGLIVFFNLYNTLFNAHGVNPVASPAGGAVRYGMFALLFAVVSIRYKYPLKSSLLLKIEWLLVALIASWSLEAIIFVIVPYALMSIYEGLVSSKGEITLSLKPIVFRLVQIGLAMVAGFGIFVGYTFLRSGSVPAVIPYIQYFLSYNNDAYATGSAFRIALWSPWVFIAGIYLIYLSYLAQSALNKRFVLPFPVVGILLAGILTTYYWIGNSSTQSFLVIWPVPLLIYGLWHIRFDKRLMPVTGIASGIILVIMFAMGVVYGNSTHRGIPFTLLSTLTSDEEIVILPLDRYTITYNNLFGRFVNTDDVAQAAIELAENDIPEDAPLTILIGRDSSITALLNIGKSQIYPLTNEANDSLSPGRLDQMRQYTENINTGHYIITRRNWDDIGLDLASHTTSASHIILESICNKFDIIEQRDIDGDVALLEVVAQGSGNSCDAYWDRTR